MNARESIGVITLAAAVSLGCGDQLSAPAGPPERPAPPPAGPTLGPWPTATGDVFVRVSPHDASTTAHHGRLGERFVIGDDGRFALQFNSAKSGFFEYPGSHSLVERTFEFAFDARNTAGPWMATGTLRENCMSVEYNIVMWLADFRNGTYCRPEQS